MGGETLGEPDALENLGGDRDGGVASPDAGVSGPQPSQAGSAPVTLTYSSVTARTSQGCGGYTYAVRWGLSGATANTNGFIVQQLTFDLRRQRCAGGDDNFAKRYWEAWQVRNGQIFVGTSASAHRADTFQVPSTPGEHGVNSEEGQAKFIPDYSAPLSWGGVPEAGALPATETQPAGWSTAGAIVRSVSCAFDCCGSNTTATISGQG